MLKNTSLLEVKKNDRIYTMIIQPDSPLGECYDVLCEMQAEVVRIINENLPKPEKKKIMSRQLLYDTLRTRAISASYAAFTGGVLAHPASIVKVVNQSSDIIFISTDGTNDMDVVPSGGFFLYDVTTNSPDETGSVYIKAGTQFYAKGAGAGTVYLAVLYIKRFNTLGQT